MTGDRSYEKARLRLVEPICVPEEMRPGMRELLSLSSADRGRGHATALMHQVCQEADDNLITLILIVDPYDAGMDEKQLERWYTRFGFTPIQPTPLMMARQVQPNRIITSAG